MRKIFLALLMGLFIHASAGAVIVDPEAPRLYFISPLDGANLKSPFIVRFGLANWGVAPAGVRQSRTGHHHLLINSDPPALDEPIPLDDYHRHYGAGQTEALIHLVPGTYKLRLVLGDADHIPIPGLVSEVRTIHVIADDN